MSGEPANFNARAMARWLAKRARRRGSSGSFRDRGRRSAICSTRRRG